MSKLLNDAASRQPSNAPADFVKTVGCCGTIEPNGTRQSAPSLFLCRCPGCRRQAAQCRDHSIVEITNDNLSHTRDLAPG
jgi:hypothetical protein